MSIRLRIPAPTGLTLAILLERLRDGQYLDFADATGSGTSSVGVGSCLFSGSAWATPTLALPEASAPAGVSISGVYELTLSGTGSGQFTDGDYAAYAIDLGGNLIQALGFTMFGGDDTTQPPNTATVTTPVTVSGFTGGLVVPLPPALLAISHGAVTNVADVLTWHDPGTSTPRVILTPDGSGGYTSQVL